MKTKKCPQCKNLISISAPTCLYCGRPNKFATNNYVKRKWYKDYNKNNLKFFNLIFSKKLFLISIFVLIILIIFLYQ